jgi:hypothetical protein
LQLKEAEAPAAAEGNRYKKVVKATVNSEHLSYHQLQAIGRLADAYLEITPKHSKEDIQTKRVEKEARSQSMAKKAYLARLGLKLIF